MTAKKVIPKSSAHKSASGEPIHRLPPVFVGRGSEVLPQAEENWGMAIMGVQYLRTITDGAGIKLGVVDTGIDDTHAILAPNFKKAKDFTRSSAGYRDRNGHGSHCSGTVFGSNRAVGVASGAEGYHGKGLGDSGSGGNGLMDAIEWCLSEGCEVVSNSWGGGSLPADWQRRFREWEERGVWLIFAGGNSGPNTPDADNPGRSQHLINVAALGLNLSPASFSSAGDKLDTSGPGVNIWSARAGGGYVQMSGTSMATPFVAGVMGLFRRALHIMGKPIPKVPELRELLFRSSTDTHTPGDDRRTGPGWITPALLAAYLEDDPLPVT